MTKILLVEDDLNLGTILKEFLEIKDFFVKHCLDGYDGYKEFEAGKYDICILDVMMPKLDGFSLAKEIRKIDEHTPIIFLTAKSMQKDKIEGFKIGGDDYITKPFSTEELLYRISAILKRVKNGAKGESSREANIYKIGSHVFDYSKRVLLFKNKQKSLTSKEAELLKLLCENKNELLERSKALKEIWKDDNYFTSRSMDVYIVKLRSYLKDDPKISISNIHGMGFKLIV